MRILLGLLLMFPVAAHAAAKALAGGAGLGARRMFVLLFLMLGPIKILVPFVSITHGTDAAFRRRPATRALLFSLVALILGGALGRTLLRIPTKPAMHSNLKPATCSDAKPAGIPI